ncbi:MAG: MFS transporter, partial [Candidatus Saccharimonadales bacterium]
MVKLTRAIQPLLLPFNSLQNNPTWRRLYFAEMVSLLGDTFTWVGIALLAYAFGGISQAATILAIALTLRVTAFIIFSPIAGVIADRLDRKKILYITHIFRTVIVGLLPFVTLVWQIYLLIFLLNIFNAFFTPTFQAVIPQVVVRKENYASAIGLYNATYQLLGVLGPGLAGVFAAWLGAREVFFVDALSFIIAAILI